MICSKYRLQILYRFAVGGPLVNIHNMYDQNGIVGLRFLKKRFTVFLPLSFVLLFLTKLSLSFIIHWQRHTFQQKNE